MARYKYPGVDDSNGIIDNDNGRFIQPNSGDYWNEYQQWLAASNVPDAQFTTEEQNQHDYDQRQAERLQNLKSALINQFKMILELFQVGRDKGLWVVADFDPALVTLAQEWKDLIDDYEADSP